MHTSLIYHHLEPYLHSRVRCAVTGVQVYCPFVRTPALRRLREAMPATAQLSVTMRWDARSFATGASDPEVFSYCRASGVDLRRHPNLHLKLFVIDDVEVVAGSANLTERALRGAAGDNVEFMVTGLHFTADDAAVVAALKQGSRPVSELDADMARAAAADAPPMGAPAHTPRSFESCLLSEIPSVATPRDLWESYRCVSVPYPDTEFGRQLQAYQIPPGLDEPGFLAAIRSAFFASPLLARLTDELRTRDLYFGELKRWLLATCADSGGLSARDLTDATGVLLDWMEGLGSPRYVVDRPHYSERVRYRTGVPSEVLLRAPGIRSNRALPEEG